MGEAGRDAEILVEERIRAALPAEARVWPNVSILARTRLDMPAHDAEADLVVLHPEHGLLVIEVKAGAPSRDARGHWYLGNRQLPRSPFKQAEDAKHDLVRAIEGLPDWPHDADGRPRQLRAGHAVAFPGADLASLPRGHVLLGPDVDQDIVLDAAALDEHDPAATHAALERAWAVWTGDGRRGSALTPALFDLVSAYVAPTVALHRLVRRDVEDARDRLIGASRAQLLVLNQNRSRRRVDVAGPAGSGKSLVAVEKARRLAREGFRTLFLCFNSPLATAVLREFEDDGVPQERRPIVFTFHGLAEWLGSRAGTLAPRPPVTAPPAVMQAWFGALPRVLDGAITSVADERFHAIVVDEGQDFELGWLESLEFLFATPADGVLWIFHDPGQALYRDDAVGRLAGLDRLELSEDWRSPAPVAALAAHFYHGPTAPDSMGEGGLAPIIERAAPGAETVDAVRRHLHRLVAEEDVRSWDIVVLSGSSAPRSAVWAQRDFGNARLWNGAIDDAGVSLGLPADQVADEPSEQGTVRFETIRRFKGLERPVVILCELSDDTKRLDQLLYTALTRATAHLVVIAPPAIASRLEAARRP